MRGSESSWVIFLFPDSESGLSQLMGFFRIFPSNFMSRVGQWKLREMVVIGWLIFLTVAALLPFNPEGPFDARDYSAATGVELVYPNAGVVLEPLLGPAEMVFGEPDYRIAAISMLIWSVIIAGYWKNRSSERSWRLAQTAKLAFTAIAVAMMFLMYIFIVVLLPLPGWVLQVNDPDLVVVDLHSHSLNSHDGLVTREQNLMIHAKRGFDVVAFTEHNHLASPNQPEPGSLQYPGLPYSLKGAEIKTPAGGYVLTLGWLPASKKYIEQSKNDLMEKPLISLAWKLDVEGVRAIAPHVNGFEIANAGHPDIPDDVRLAVIEAAKKHNLVLIGTSDWHGWSGFWRVWTTVRVPGALHMTGKEKAIAVVEAIKGRQQADIQPVVAGYLGTPGSIRALLSPVWAAARYGMELSPLRVLSWWVWGAFVLALAAWLERVSLRPGRVFLILGTFSMALILFIRGVMLLVSAAPGIEAQAFVSSLGIQAMAAGGVAFLASQVLLMLEFKHMVERIHLPMHGTSDLQPVIR